MGPHRVEMLLNAACTASLFYTSGQGVRELHAILRLA
jgi:hypothetical protein